MDDYAIPQHFNTFEEYFKIWFSHAQAPASPEYELTLLYARRMWEMEQVD